MALITCPECGKQISSNASCCPECGCPASVFKKSYVVTCNECGTEMDVNSDECPVCGCPVSKSAELVTDNNNERLEELNLQHLPPVNGFIQPSTSEQTEHTVDESKKSGSSNNIWKFAIIIGLVAATITAVKEFGFFGLENDSSQPTSLYQSQQYEDNNDNGYESAYGSEDDNDNYDSSSDRSLGMRFYTAHDVLAYLESHSFGTDDQIITINGASMYFNGVCMTGAVNVIEFDKTQALITAVIPQNGGRLSFMVDCEKRCITDNDNVYFER